VRWRWRYRAGPALVLEAKRPAMGVRRLRLRVAQQVFGEAPQRVKSFG